MSTHYIFFLPSKVSTLFLRLSTFGTIIVWGGRKDRLLEIGFQIFNSVLSRDPEPEELAIEEQMYSTFDFVKKSPGFYWIDEVPHPRDLLLNR